VDGWLAQNIAAIGELRALCRATRFGRVAAAGVGAECHRPRALRRQGQPDGKSAVYDGLPWFLERTVPRDNAADGGA